MEGDDEWIFRSETPPRSRGPEKHPFSFETRIESNGIPLWFIAVVSRFTFEKQRDIFLSKRVDTTRVDSPLLGNAVSKSCSQIFSCRGGPPPFFRRSEREGGLSSWYLKCELFWDWLRLFVRCCRLISFFFNLWFEKGLILNCILSWLRVEREEVESNIFWSNEFR